MAVSSSSSYYNSLVAGNKGIGGLISGMDTDELVDQLTLGTRTKIAKQYQQKQLLEWRQEAYRGVRTTLVALQSKYLNTGSQYSTSFASGSIGNTDFFQEWLGTVRASAGSVTGSDYVTFNNSGTTSSGEVVITDVVQLASNASYRTATFEKVLVGTSPYSTNAADYDGQSLTLRLDGGRAYTVDLTGINPSNMVSELQTRINSTVGFASDKTTPLVTVSSVGGAIKLDSGVGTNQVSVVYDCKPLNLTNNDSNRLNITQTLGQVFSGSQYNLYEGNLEFKINGITFTATKDTQLNKLMDEISTKANVDLIYDKATQTFKFTSKTPGAGEVLSFEDVQGNLLSNWLGIPPGNTFVSSDNNLDTGYDTMLRSGRTPPITDDVLLEQFFGTGWTYPPSSSISMSYTIAVNGISKTLSVNISNADLLALWPKDDDGVLYDPTLLPPTDPYTIEATTAIANAIRKEINEQLKAEIYNKFGTTDVFAGISNGNELVFTTTDDKTLEFTAASGDWFTYFGFAAGTHDNYTSAVSTSLSSFSDLNDTQPHTFRMTYGGNNFYITYDVTTDTINDLVNAINSAIRAFTPDSGTTYPYADHTVASVRDGKLVLEGDKGQTLEFTEDPADDPALTGQVGNLLKFMFGTSRVENPTPRAGTMTEGKNAEIIIDAGTGNPADDIKLVSNTNTFEVNGLSFTVNKATGEVKDVSGGPPATPDWQYVPDGNWTSTITITSEPDVDAVYNKIVEFVEDYNTLYSALSTIINEEYDRNYQPLTDEQKEAMTEKEIEKWENTAKTGILRNDSAIRKVLSDLRMVFYNTVESAGLAAYSIGITTKGIMTDDTLDLSKSGLLEINEEVLRAALTDIPGAVAELFTNNTDGIARQLYNAIDEATRTTLGKEGTLVQIAGVDNLIRENTIDKKIENIDDYISRLNLRLKNEYNRHWRRFSALETALSNMNTQSGWLNSFYSS